MPDTTVFTPTDILNIVKEHLRTVNSTVVIEGVYQRVGQRAYSSGIWWYDELKSQYDNSKLKAMVPTGIRDQIQQGDVVQLCGTISKNVNDYDGKIELILRVSSLLGKRDNVLSDEDVQRLQLLQKKASRGSRPVDSLLESLLFASDRRPRVALLFAESSITDADFRAGLQAAAAAVDFTECRHPFSDIPGVVERLKAIDADGYDVLCVIRGGGSGLELFDNIALAEGLMGLSTPTVTAIGHETDMPLLCKVSDRNLGTPSLLGQYFKDMVEQVSEKKTRSRAALTEQIRRQFQQQLEAGQKQNKELQEKLAKITKSNEDAQKQQTEAMGKLQAQLKQQTEQQAKQVESFGKQLNNMQETNKQLQNNLAKMTEQTNETNRQLGIAQSKSQTLERQLKHAANTRKRLIIYLVLAVVLLILLAIALFSSHS